MHDNTQRHSANKSSEEDEEEILENINKTIKYNV